MLEGDRGKALTNTGLDSHCGSNSVAYRTVGRLAKWLMRYVSLAGPFIYSRRVTALAYHREQNDVKSHLTSSSFVRLNGLESRGYLMVPLKMLGMIVE